MFCTYIHTYIQSWITKVICRSCLCVLSCGESSKVIVRFADVFALFTITV